MNIEKEIEIFLLKCYEEKLSYNTIINYKCRIKAFLRYFEDKKAIEEITLEEFKKYLKAEISPNTRFTNVNAVKLLYLLTNRTSIDFSGFNKTPRKKQARVIKFNQDDTLRYVSKKLGVKEGSIELIKSM